MRKLPLIAMLMVTACKVGPDYEATAIAFPDSWMVSDSAQVQAIPLAWWTRFNDPTLTTLVEEGIAHNGDVELAAARVSEARALLQVSESDLYPTLSYQVGATRASQSSEARFGGLGSIPSKPYNNFSLSAVLDYEIDLWGRIRRSNEAARATLLAEKTNADAVQLAVASDIASGYFNLLAIDAQLRITEQTIASRQSSFEYQEAQYKAGAVDTLTYRQAEAELAVAQAALPALQQARVDQENALSVLLGRSPRAIMEQRITGTQTLASLPVPPVMPSETPSTLLTRRPDVVSAEQQLIASNAAIGVAKADYFPTLSLSGLLGLSSADIDRTLRNSARTWNIGANMAGPILDIGRIGGNVDAAKARKDQAMATYQQTVRNAFSEALSALHRIDTSAARVQALHCQVNARSESMQVANLRYDAGYSNHLELLDAQRYLYQAQLDEVEAQRDRLTATVTLYKALGGGWSEADTPARNDAAANAPREEETTRAKQPPATLPEAEKMTAEPKILPFKKAGEVHR